MSRFFQDTDSEEDNSEKDNSEKDNSEGDNSEENNLDYVGPSTLIEENKVLVEELEPIDNGDTNSSDEEKPRVNNLFRERIETWQALFEKKWNAAYNNNVLTVSPRGCNDRDLYFTKRLFGRITPNFFSDAYDEIQYDYIVKWAEWGENITLHWTEFFIQNRVSWNWDSKIRTLELRTNYDVGGEPVVINFIGVSKESTFKPAYRMLFTEVKHLRLMDQYVIQSKVNDLHNRGYKVIWNPRIKRLHVSTLPRGSYNETGTDISVQLLDDAVINLTRLN
jgi:hypothetical protein